MKIFVINLKKSIDRRKHMESQLKKLDLEYEFIDAVDGRALSDEELREQSNLDLYMQHPTWEKRGKGIIGCALSHQNVYKEILKRKIPRALILEDDVFISKDIAQLLKKIDSMHNIDFKELILFEAESLGEKVQLSLFDKRNLVKDYALHYPINVENLWLASAYVISYESAKEFLKVYPKVERVADVWGAFYERNIFTTISCVVPFVVYQGAFDSSIGSFLQGATFKSRVKHFLKENIPFLYLQLVKLKSTKDNYLRKRYILKKEYSIFHSKYDFSKSKIYYKTEKK